MSTVEVVDDSIWTKLLSIKITDAQIDPFGFCNAKCWFCPVRYQKNPTYAAKHMSVDLMDKILGQLASEKTREDGIVDKDFRHFYTAHYNEILLYKHLEEMLQLSRKYGFMTMILSNGTNLTEEKVEILSRYKDVISGINLNIPAFEEELWRDRSGVAAVPFDDLVSGVKRTMRAFPEYVANGAFSIGVNVPTEESLFESGGWMKLGPNAPDIDLSPEGEQKQQVALGRSLFKGLNVYPVSSLVDRASFLARAGVIDNSDAILRIRPREAKVINCSNGVKGRIYGWLHVNAVGEAFLCCNDYDFDYTFGSFAENDLRQIWFSNKHGEMIERALGTICRNCASAVWQ
jgi:sulfatase maturation enzyme AslB (radical SAM superfamily)